MKYGGCRFKDYETGKIQKARSTDLSDLSDEGICFYRPFPQKKLNILDLFRFVEKILNAGDWMLFFLFSLISALLGMVTPKITQCIFGTVIPSGDFNQLEAMAVLAVGTAISLISQICQMLGDTVFTGVTGALFSLIYLFQIQSFAPVLTVPAITVLLIQVIVMVFQILVQMKISRKMLKISSKLNGLVFQLFSGIQKIKLAGAEKRAFAQWADKYSQYVSLIYHPPFLVKMQSASAAVIALGGTIVFYLIAAKSGISQADYMAFSASYGLMSGSILSLAAVVSELGQIKPMAEMAEPILKAVPETAEGKKY